MKEKINTLWECWSYDVWGNQRDGYEVNDRYCIHREYPLTLIVETNNQGTGQEFRSAYPSAKQIREALDIRERVWLEFEGDDMAIYVSHKSTGYPVGEMHCISHTRLSPIRV